MTPQDEVLRNILRRKAVLLPGGVEIDHAAMAKVIRKALHVTPFPRTSPARRGVSLPPHTFCTCLPR